jgi:hypothetical protein
MLKTPEKNKRRMTLNRLMDAIEMLKTLVRLSMYGLTMLMVMRNAASRMTKATACVAPLFCATATKRPLTRM